MRKVIVVEWMSLDGVVQSAGAADDTTGGFEHGGWRSSSGEASGSSMTTERFGRYGSSRAR